MHIRFAVDSCPLGLVLVAASNWGLRAVLLGDDAATLHEELQARLPEATLVPADAECQGFLAQVKALIEAPYLALTLPLAPQGTPFQQQVWQALQAVPPGQTTSYSALARRIGAPRAARAVARACGANPLAVVIPCHRALAADGTLSGYRWGTQRKRALLERERLYTPGHRHPLTPQLSEADIFVAPDSRGTLV